ncbi:MAG: inosine/xanthosine triphosphatase [Anaerolineaceae bacterium]|nr:inosine/xanthosine triphosphatase [Anaerolineaceae bacterium]
MKTIVIASHNPVKIQSVREGFLRMFPGQSFDFVGVDVPSQVSDQPTGSAETLLGAQNRAQNAAVARPEADYWVGIEGGIEDEGESMRVFAWIVVRSAHLIGKSCTGSFYLPSQVAELVRTGKELGDADDIVFQRSNSKQKNGAIGILTGDALDRAQYYEQAVIMALIPFKNPELYERANGH